MATTTGEPTIRDARNLLGSLGFAHEPSDRFQQIHHHSQSGAIVVLPNRAESASLTKMDLISLRRHLIEQGFLDQETFLAFVQRGQIPGSPRDAA